MEHLRDYVLKYQKYNFCSDYCNSLESFMQNNYFTDLTITEEASEWYFNKYWNDISIKKHNESTTRGFYHINEMLKTHDIKFLVNELNKEFLKKYKNPITVLSKEDSKSNISGYKLSVPKNIYFDEFDKFIDICDKFMWMVTSRGHLDYTDKRARFKVVEIEPFEAENCTDFVKNNCKGIIYHITTKKNSEHIKNLGLRCKGEKRQQRFYTNRIYFGCGKTKDDIIKSLIKIRETPEIPQKDTVVYMIDVSKTNLNFYRDPYDYPDVDAIYTFSNIPPKLIVKEINIL